MFSRLFGSKKSGKETTPLPSDFAGDWSFIGCDMHSHLIPGIDDGAVTIEDSLNLVGRLKDMGFKSLVTTPHIKIDHYPNTTVIINEGLKDLRQALNEAGIDMPIRAAAEYYIDQHFIELLDNKELMTITENQVLVEMSFLFEPMKLHNILFNMQTNGYKPILAHPERYAFYHDKFEAYRTLKNMGCLLQLNTISLTGYYGKPVKAIAERLLEERLYDYCGSDMHHFRHADTLEKISKSSGDTIKKLYNYPFLNKNLEVTIL